MGRTDLKYAELYPAKGRWHQQGTETLLGRGSSWEAASASFADNHPRPSSWRVLNHTVSATPQSSVYIDFMLKSGKGEKKQ